MIIRPEQIESMSRAEMPRFRAEMLEHIRAHFPKHFELLQEPGLDAVIRIGFERGKQLGLETRHQMILFLDYRIMLGSGFETDPQLPWAAAILGSLESNRDAAIDRLYQATMSYLDVVVGQGQVFPTGPLRKMLEYPVVRLQQPSLAATPEQGLLAEFQSIWPQKFRRVGVESLRTLIATGRTRAAEYGLAGPRGTAAFVIAAYLLGHEFDRDPQYPWLGAVLRDPGLKTEAAKVESFHASCQAVLGKAFAASGKKS